MGGHRSRLLHLPTRILKGYIETLPGYGHKYHPDGLSSMLRRVCILENISQLWAQWTGCIFQGQ